MTSMDFSKEIDVSRETLEHLDVYLSLLRRWQKAINLVGSKTLDDPWRRHLLDSAQLIRHLPEQTGPIADLGSGAGLPGMVLAILGLAPVHLVESDQRKAQFLKETARQLDVDVVIHNKRIEDLDAISPHIVTARALAPLPKLLNLASRLIHRETICLFLKGRQAKDELTEAKKSWMMASQILPSLTDPSASILKLWDIERATLHREQAAV